MKRLRKNSFRHAVAIVSVVVGLGGAFIAAVVVRDARDRLSGMLLLDIGEAWLVVECGRNGHLMCATLVLLPCDPDVRAVHLRLLFRGRPFDGDFQKRLWVVTSFRRSALFTGSASSQGSCGCRG